jgi:acetaldehyde dehydrogenase (acetylating)
MIDEIFDRQYQAGRKELHGGIDRMVRRVGSALAATFRTMHRVQFDAPWATKKRPGCA